METNQFSYLPEWKYNESAHEKYCRKYSKYNSARFVKL